MEARGVDLASAHHKRTYQMATNDDQAAQLVAALAPILSAALLPQITEHVEKQIKGVVSKNAELLDKLAARAKDDDVAAHQKRTDELTAQAKRLAEGAPKKENGLTDFRKAGEAVKISRTDARDTAIYKKAKALAAEQGVALEIVADECHGQP